MCDTIPKYLVISDYPSEEKCQSWSSEGGRDVWEKWSDLLLLLLCVFARMDIKSHIFAYLSRNLEYTQILVYRIYFVVNSSVL